MSVTFAGDKNGEALGSSSGHDLFTGVSGIAGSGCDDPIAAGQLQRRGGGDG